MRAGRQQAGPPPAKSALTRAGLAPVQGPVQTPVEAIQVELRAWEWQELRHHHGGLELVITREALLLQS